MAAREDFEPMDIYFAMFNNHVNDAKKKAKKDFIDKFGRRAWDERIDPFHKKGIMSIFHISPTRHTKWYAERIQHYVNNGREFQSQEKVS